jgi:hypothetical protein
MRKIGLLLVLLFSQVSAEPEALKLERIMVICTGVSLRLQGTDFGTRVFAKAYPDKEHALQGLLTVFGASYSRGAQLYYRSHTDGEARRARDAGAHVVDQLNEDVDGAVKLLHVCDDENERLARLMDW